MDLEDIITTIIPIVIIAGLISFMLIWGLILFTVSFYVAAYTVALIHIIFVEPVIFDTHSLFTIPYNEIWIMANIYPLFYWLVALTYLFGGMEGMGKILSIDLNNLR